MLQEIEEILRAAFQPPEPPHVDIFGVAAQVARGNMHDNTVLKSLVFHLGRCQFHPARAGEEVPAIVPNEDQYVPRHIFIAETQQLLLASAKSLMIFGKRLSKKR